MTLPRPYTPKQIWVEIRLDGEEFASSVEFDDRWTLEDAVMDRGIGEVMGGGSGGGWMDFNFSVEEIDSALDRFVALLDEYSIRERCEILVLDHRNESSGEDCNEDHTFQAGDVLLFRYADGDYGAGIILVRTDEQVQHPWRDKVLFGVLDYKAAAPPPTSLFAQQSWLDMRRDWTQGQPFMAWMSGCGVEMFQKVDEVTLTNTIPRCQLHLNWEILAEMVALERHKPPA